MGPNRKICKCMHVYEAQLIAAIKSEGTFDLETLKEFTFAGKGCGTCGEDIEKVIREYQQQQDAKLRCQP